MVFRNEVGLSTNFRKNLSGLFVIVAVLGAFSALGADFVTETRKVPVLYDVDVVVAGGGGTGIYAAIAAARSGARTVVVERYSRLGGTAGPGLNTGGGTQEPGPVTAKERPGPGLEYLHISIYPETVGISKEFSQRLAPLLVMGFRARPVRCSPPISHGQCAPRRRAWIRAVPQAGTLCNSH